MSDIEQHGHFCGYPTCKMCGLADKPGCLEAVLYAKIADRDRQYQEQAAEYQKELEAQSYQLQAANRQIEQLRQENARLRNDLLLHETFGRNPEQVDATLKAAIATPEAYAGVIADVVAKEREKLATLLSDANKDRGRLAAELIGMHKMCQSREEEIGRLVNRVKWADRRIAELEKECEKAMREPAEARREGEYRDLKQRCEKLETSLKNCMTYVDVDNLTMQSKYREWEESLTPQPAAAQGESERRAT